ncbi:hypothetical protein [Lactobacillus helveticus]|uniref:hypothetical protein n=2 Tax=Lactobacillus helveticus TaxID=1587 RepID=UPI001561B044|nr:hypothetical protein [Lactobacillus helveticus]NRN90259.1 hypothetical protein [Lactobacillus helveticus]NRN94534.1 hypothetical protein [Lactobacillus helveticus]NRO05043.1 hypothetical protein [Lactobacillus helveticus]NRO07086.1 hypothetical protein [Lactobacillus helveticus]NRO55574.1 hypothetical protein [Lactobacillus helveticus]
MKSNKLLTTLLTTVTLAALLGTAPITVKASNYSSNVTAKQKKHYVIQNAPKLSKWGYVLNVNSSTQPIFVGKNNYKKLLNNPLFKGTKTVNPKEIKNIKFKVIKIMKFKNVNGAPEYLITSKSHKYNAWTPSSGLQYYAIHNKSLKRVINPLKRMSKRDSERLNKKTTAKGAISGQKRIAQNKHDFDLAVKSARKLKGNQRKFVLGSLQQMKQDDGIRNVMQEKQNNILLWSIN